MHYSMLRHHHVHHYRHRIPIANPDPTAQSAGECDWTLIEISSERQQRSPDPMQVVGYIGLVLIVVLYLNHLDWNVSVALLNLYLSPYVLLCLRIAMSMAVLNRTMYPNAVNASDEEEDDDDVASPLRSDVWALEWYWWNAFLLRAIMSESSSGFSLRLVPLVVDDAATLSSSQCYSTDAALSWWTIGTVALVVLYPLYLTTCLVVLIQSPHRFALEFIVSAMQLMGVLVFLVPAIAKSFAAATNDDTIIEAPLLAWTPNEIEATTHFSLHQCLYGWFGLWWCSAIWGVIPLYRLRRAVMGWYWYYEHYPE
jgi:hypothetical protein